MKGMDHERSRFKSMTTKQLYIRLGRITKEEKLRMFIVVADEWGYRDLAWEARQKLSEMIAPVKAATPASAIVTIPVRRPVRTVEKFLFKKTETSPATPGKPLKRLIEF